MLTPTISHTARRTRRLFAVAGLVAAALAFALFQFGDTAHAWVWLYDAERVVLGPLDTGDRASFELRICGGRYDAAGGNLVRIETVEPSGWGGSSDVIVLPAGTCGMARLSLTVADDAPAGAHAVDVRATNLAYPTHTDLQAVTVNVVPQPGDPDRFEPNQFIETATPLSFATTDPGTDVTHASWDPRVLENGSSVLATAERWTMIVHDLSLHRPSDFDHFRVTLPAITDARLPECHSYTHTGFGGFEERVSFSGTLTVQMLLPRNAIDELLVGTPRRLDGIIHGDDIVVTTHRLQFDCPRANFGPIDFHYGNRSLRAAERANFPTYGMRITYSIDVTRTPIVPDRFLDEDEFNGLGPIGDNLCDDADCALALDDPLDAVPVPFVIPCWADGCPDHDDSIAGQDQAPEECESLVETPIEPNANTPIDCKVLTDDFDGPAPVPDQWFPVTPFSLL